MRTGNTQGVRITVDAEIQTASPNNDRSLRMFLNNNTTSQANSPLNIATDGNAESIIFNWPKPDGNTIPVSGGWDKAKNQFWSLDFLPARFNQTNIATLEQAFFQFYLLGGTGDSSGAKILIKGIKIERLVTGTANFTVNVDADFAGFPDTFDLHLAPANGDTSKSFTLTGSGFDTADWYVDGEKEGTGKTWTLNSTGLSTGKHFLTVAVTVNGHRYSKTAEFAVKD
jgi:hypothetical protein